MLKFLIAAVLSMGLVQFSVAEQLDLDAISELEEVTSDEEFANEDSEETAGSIEEEAAEQVSPVEVVEIDEKIPVAKEDQEEFVSVKKAEVTEVVEIAEEKAQDQLEVIESEEEMTPEMQAMIDEANADPATEKETAEVVVETAEVEVIEENFSATAKKAAATKATLVKKPVKKGTQAKTKAKSKASVTKRIVRKKKTIPIAEYIPSKSQTLVQEASLADYGIESGFYFFNNDCAMRSTASLDGQIVGVIRKGKRLWVDDKGAGWVTVYRTSGPAYVDLECL